MLGQSYSVAASRFSLRSNETFTLAKNVTLELDGYYKSHSTDGLTRNGGYGNLDAGLLVYILQGKAQLRLNGQEILQRTQYYTSQDFGVYSTYRNRYFDNR